MLKRLSHRDVNEAAIQALHGITVKFKLIAEVYCSVSWAFGALGAALKGPEQGYGRLTVEAMMSPTECTETLFADFRDDVYARLTCRHVHKRLLIWR